MAAPAKQLGSLLPLATAEGEISVDLVANAMRQGTCPSERMFDQFLPLELRLRSSQYWTPLFVAMRAAAWFEALGVRTVIDIGSGAGKFCIAAALAGSARYVGIEHRRRLVIVARDLARVFDVDERVTFVAGALGETKLTETDAYYLYNPFVENIFDREDRLDEDVELSDVRYQRDVGATEEILEDAPTGTVLLNYNGFGGQVPRSYEEMRMDGDRPNLLRIWRKRNRFGRPAP